MGKITLKKFKKIKISTTWVKRQNKEKDVWISSITWPRNKVSDLVLPSNSSRSIRNMIFSAKPSALSTCVLLLVDGKYNYFVA